MRRHRDRLYRPNWDFYQWNWAQQATWTSGFCALGCGGHLVYETLWKKKNPAKWHHEIMDLKYPESISWKEQLEGQKYYRDNALMHIINPYPFLLSSLKLQFFSFVSFLSPLPRKRKLVFKTSQFSNVWKKNVYTYTGDKHVDHSTSKNTMNFNSEIDCEYQFSSVAQSCLTFCDPMNRSTPGLPVHHQLPEFTQTHVHRVGDTI